MTKKRMLADVLWDAANLRLSPTTEEPSGTVTASCCAAYWAEHGREWWTDSNGLDWIVCCKRSQAVMFLRTLGCRVGGTGFKSANDRQGVRYMWLLLAMHVAEDEGVEI